MRNPLSKEAVMAGLIVVATACGGGGPRPVETETPATVVAASETWSPGQLQKEIKYEGQGADGRPVNIRLGLFTQRHVEINDGALQSVINRFGDRGGILPSETRILLTEKDLPNQISPEALGQTNSKLDLIVVSLGRASRTAYIYDYEALVNGVLVGELCNLMITESGQWTFGIETSRANIQLTCDSVGFMASAIADGRSYQEYLSGATNIARYFGEEGDVGVKGKILPFDKVTYADFQQALERPILEFK